MARGVQIGRGYIAVEVDEGGARAALRGFIGFAGSAFKTAAVSAGVLTGAAAKVGVSFNAMQEQAQIAFTTLLGSGAKAESFLKDLQGFAAKTPFELPGLINNARQLLGVGVAANKVIPTLNSLGNAAGALGIDQERFNNILLATTQAMGKGKLQGEELMQMVENGIPVWQLLAKATGKPVGELQKLSSEGKLIAQDVLPKLFDQMNKDYGGAMAAQSKTLVGQWSSLKDNTQILLGTAFKPLFNEIKNGAGTLNELIGSDRANQWAVSFAAGMEKGFSATRSFGQNLKTEFAPQIDALKDRFGELWPKVREGASRAVEVFAELGSRAAPAIAQLAHASSGVLGPALDAVVSLLSAVSRNADELADGLSTAANVAAAIITPAAALFGAALQLVAGALTIVVDLVGDLSGPLGALTGLVVGGIAAWKLWGGVLLGAGGAMNKLRPEKIAEAMQPLADRIGQVSERAGVMTWQLTGSANAGHKVMTAGKNIGSAMTKVGNALPYVGAAAVGLGLAWEVAAAAGRRVEETSDRLAEALLKGGKAAADAKKEMAALQRQVDQGADASTFEHVFQIFSTGRSATGEAAAALEQANQKVKELKAGMSELELAQANLATAQRDYDYAVQEFGPNSSAATSAHYALRDAAVAVDAAERGAAEATKTHEEALLDLANQALASANADVALRQANLQVAQAEKAAAEAVRQHGKDSLEAQNANLQLEQAYINAANAAVLKAQKDNAGKSASQQAAAATKAYNDKILEMVNAAGVKAPSSLLRLVDGLSDSELAAYNAAMETSGFKTQVITLPSGRTVRVAANTAQAAAALEATRRKIAEIRSKTVDIRVNVHGNAMAAAGIPTGGFSRERAVGGPIRPNEPYLVGERGPELVTPRYGGHVYTASQTASLLAGGSSGGPVINQNIYQLPGENVDQLADRVVKKITWRTA